MLLCTTKEVNEKALKTNDNLSFRYEIARGDCQTEEINVLWH